jgi:hypothetical protein
MAKKKASANSRCFHFYIFTFSNFYILIPKHQPISKLINDDRLVAIHFVGE